MKALFLIDDNLTNRISYYHLMLILVTLPFDQFFSHVILISFALHTLFTVDRQKIRAVFTTRNYILQAVFFLTLISLTYTAYPAIAGVDITRQLVILLFPVLFSLTSFNIVKYRHHLLLIFSMICVATIAGLYIHAFYIIRYFKLPISALFSNLFINHKFSNPINMHATFLSLQVAVAFFYLSLLLCSERSLKSRIFLIAACILLLTGIVQLGSKAVLVVILIGINIVIPYFLIPATKRFKYVLISSALSILLVASALSINSFKTRFVTGLETDLSNQIVNESVEPRIVRWQAAMHLVQKRPIAGYGAGSELKILGDEYFKEKLYISYLNNLNAHNQYITFLLTTGIIGLLVYLSTLYFGIKTAVKHRDMLFFIFILLIATVSLSESLLNAEKGVYFYSLFFSIFVFSNPEKVISRNYLFT
ncbi:MAG: O-antigen ligase family protein [Bacteroidota bacterium]